MRWHCRHLRSKKKSSTNNWYKFFFFLGRGDGRTEFGSVSHGYTMGTAWLVPKQHSAVLSRRHLALAFAAASKKKNSPLYTSRLLLPKRPTLPAGSAVEEQPDRACLPRSSFSMKQFCRNVSLPARGCSKARLPLGFCGASGLL